MSLDRSYFENIAIECVRGKFYKKQDVDALLKDIERKAEIAQKDNEILTLKLENIERQFRQLGDVNETARGLAQDIVAEANSEADKILAASSAAADSIIEKAKKQAGEIIASAEEKRETIISEAGKKKEEFTAKLKEAWMSFLAEQEAASEITLPKTVAEERKREESEPENESGNEYEEELYKRELSLPEDVPEDMGGLLEQIARTLTEIDKE